MTAAAEALRCPLSGLLTHGFPIAWRPVDGERANQAGGGPGDVVHSLIEGSLVDARRLARTASLRTN